MNWWKLALVPVAVSVIVLLIALMSGFNWNKDELRQEADDYSKH